LFAIDEAGVVAHEADEPDAVVDFPDPEFLTGQDGGDVDPLAVDADTATGVTSTSRSWGG